MGTSRSSNTEINDSQCQEVLAFVDVVRSLDVVGLDEPDLKNLLISARHARAGIDALIWRVGAEADRLAARGQSAPAEELLAADGNVRASTAKKDAERSRMMNEVNGLHQAAATGQIGSDHIDSLTSRLKKLTDVERRQLDQRRLVEKAATMPADRFDRVVKDAVDRIRHDHGLQDTQQKRQASEFQHWFDHKTGMGKFSGQLDPERYETLTTVIDQHTVTLAAAEGDRVVRNSNLAVAALVELVTNSRERSQNLPHITVVVDHETLTTGPHQQTIRETGDGHPVPPQTIERLACDALLQRVTLDERGVPINVGRKYRTATNAQWVALRATYATCAWPECERPLRWCQLHHIVEWRDGGRTDLDNLVPLCSTHHHRVHEGQWSIQLQSDRSLKLRKPDRQLHQTVDPPTRRSGEPETTGTDFRRRPSVE